MKFSTLTRITVPAAMVVFLTIEITQQQEAVGWLVYVIAAAAFLSSIGIELWGITAGENLKKAWANGAGKASTAVQMVAYVAVAGWMLRTNDTLLVLPLVAALAYVASAWADGYQEAEQKTAERSAWEQGQEEKDREWERQLEAKKLDADTAVKLARVEAKARETKPKPASETAKVTTETKEVAVNLDELSGNKLQIYTLFRENPDASNTQVAETLGVSRQYVGQVKKELNGALRN